MRGDVTLRSTKGTRPPGVLAWYRVYCILMQALSLAIIAGGILLIIFKEDLAAQVAPPELLLVFGIILIVLGSISDLAFFAAFFLPRRRWAWIYHLLMLVLGGLILGSIAGLCSLALSIPLFIFWVREETREYFGWESVYVPRDRANEGQCEQP